MDQVTASYANIAIIAERLSAKLLDGSVSLLPPQLDADDGSLPYIGCLPMAATGYEEELRMLTQATLLPGSESGGFGQNDVASPVFLAWSKQERAGVLLEATLAALAPAEITRSFFVSSGAEAVEGALRVERARSAVGEALRSGHVVGAIVAAARELNGR